MRALTLQQASNCEHARHPCCKCRCGGALHGAARGDGPLFYLALPEDDPHHYNTKEMKEKRAASKRQQARNQRKLLLARRQLELPLEPSL